MSHRYVVNNFFLLQHKNLLFQWNNHGYDVAKLFANKFSHISPVWLQILRKGESKYEIAGTHDIDNSWIQDVKKAGIKRGVKSTEVFHEQFNETFK